MAVKVKVVALFALAAGALVGLQQGRAAVTAAKTYTAASWEAAFNTVPCDAFRRNADGSWSETGTIIAGNTVMSGKTFSHTREAQALEKRCGGQKHGLGPN